MINRWIFLLFLADIADFFSNFVSLFLFSFNLSRFSNLRFKNFPYANLLFRFKPLRIRLRSNIIGLIE